MNEQFRRGLNRLVELDHDTAHIRRGQLQFDIDCRISYQSGGVWNNKNSTEQGNTIDTTPYILAGYDVDIREGDIAVWHGRKFRIGVVTRPTFDGGVVCTQAPLVELEPDK
jgi:hypothetical protein